MIEKVEKFIIENNLQGKKILLGFSGGADSTSLADILAKLKDKLNLNLVFVHLNHNWRGDEAAEDKVFCENFAANRGVEFYFETLDNRAKQNETTARELRYAFFESCKKKFEADAIFLAHNKNDNVETLIYRLIKGTGHIGLNSIPKIRDFYFRPLLDTTRAEIEEYVEKNALEFRVDKTNFDTIHKRNLIREEILPKMAEINPEIINSISNFIKLNKMTSNIVKKAMDEALLRVSAGGEILRDKFLNETTEIQFEIVNNLLKGRLKNRDFKTIERAVNFIKENASSKISINENTFLKIYNNKIYLSKKTPNENAPEIPLKLGETTFLNYKITLTECKTPKEFSCGEQFLNLDFKNPYTIRKRKTGDKITPFGQKSEQKLKTLLIKKKIPLEIRDEMPFVALFDEVLCAPFGIVSEKVRVDKNQKICYKITMEKIKD